MDTNEQRDLRPLISWLERIEPWQKLTGEDSRAWQADPRSSLAGDDAKTDPFQVSHAVWHALTVSVTEIVRGAGELTTLGADLAQLVWSGCSALAHGDAYGTLAMLDKEIVARNQDVALVRVTGSISGLYWCTVAAVLMVNQGFELLQARSVSYR
ncbi:hypothetical protein ABT294_34365 [Nonomuraea sp. NPDC000554]|uniref:hypothetical protein n=1 Tax=Nonomuraea sp. NPDC000554 TaxID=3154259 RepID=UPI003321D0C5